MANVTAAVSTEQTTEWMWPLLDIMSGLYTLNMEVYPYVVLSSKLLHAV